MRSFFFLIGEAFINLRRHSLMTVAAVTTIAVALSLIGAFALMSYQANVATNRAASEFEIHVYCREQVKKEAIPAIKKRLEGISGIRSVRYISKEKAFNEYAKNLPIDTRGIPNQFNETFVLLLKDPAKGSQIASVIRGWHEEVEEVALPEAEMGGLLRIMTFMKYLGALTGALLLIGALLVVSNTIRLSVFTRRREIRIMQIIGASPSFIRLPLFIEGLIHGILGGALAGICLAVVNHYTQGLIESVIPMLSRYFAPIDMKNIAMQSVAVGALLGAAGSLLSIHRYLRLT
jgi:cell division transport system permease protein